MAAAPIQLDISADDRGPVLERLIGSVGIALSSTVLGIALRVVFQQMRRELDDLEEAARHELEARAELLKGQLLQAVTELESFRLRHPPGAGGAPHAGGRYGAGPSGCAGGGGAQAGPEARRRGQPGPRRPQRAGAAARSRDPGPTEAAAALAERLGHVEVPPDLFRQEVQLLAERLAASFTPLEQAVAALARRITAMEVPAGLLTARLDPFAVALVRATEALAWPRRRRGGSRRWTTRSRA